MKGIIIYGNPLCGDNERATYCSFINEASFDLKTIIQDQIGQSGHYIWKVGEHKKIISCLEGEASKPSKAVCSEDDTYDFETGALISLMKMCGLEKSAKAYAEIFDDTAYGDALIERDKLKEENERLKNTRDLLTNKNNELIEENKRLNASNCAKAVLNGKLLKDYNTAKNAYEMMMEKSADLMDKVKKLEEENEKLKSDKDKSWKNYQRNIQKKQDRINELERAYKASNDDEAKLVEYYQREIKKLEAENEKLKLDCEKLQHGYNDIDNVPSGHWDGDILDIVFLPGRACGKQYKALVEMFKKLDKKKVQEAYKEAYGDRVIWCTSQPEIHPLSTAVLEGISYLNKKFKTYSIEEWLYKIPTKREKMWEKIFALHKKNDVIIEVEKEDVTTFLLEIENRIPEITWASGNKIFEAKGTIKDIYEELKTHNRIYFRLSMITELSYSSDPDIYQYKDLEHISYLPPMRWDLFKKGRLAVKVDFDNYKEFYEACKKELGKRPLTNFACIFTVSICKDDGFFEIFTVEDQKKTGRKIVDWEDVR